MLRKKNTVADEILFLAIDTCGPTGSVALARCTQNPGAGGNGAPGGAEILGRKELEGRSFSSTLVAAVGELLAEAGIQLADLGGFVVVRGPGSFTGVRVGLAAAKGFAEGADLPVAAVSRLQVMAAGVDCAALDAHRHEVFLLLPGGPDSGELESRELDSGKPARELLAGAAELAAVDPRPARIALCDEAAAALIAEAWPETEIVRVPAPTAADALRFIAARPSAAEPVDVALLDGHYLRRSDAEIFGDPAAPPRLGASLDGEREKQGTREQGNEGTRDREKQGTREQGIEGTRDREKQGTREQGNEGTRDRGNEGTREKQAASPGAGASRG
jgi:tRNA threonylcarbamoyladenosine biosynthesis protein TsaB